MTAEKIATLYRLAVEPGARLIGSTRRCLSGDLYVLEISNDPTWACDRFERVQLHASLEFGPYEEAVNFASAVLKAARRGELNRRVA